MTTYAFWVRLQFEGEEVREFPAYVEDDTRDEALVKVRQLLLSSYEEICQAIGPKDGDILVGEDRCGEQCNLVLVISVRGDAAEYSEIKKSLEAVGAQRYYSA
jgi:hypothetical protein